MASLHHLNPNPNHHSLPHPKPHFQSSQLSAKMASSSIFTVSQEEFNVFHTIDRTLFARMVLGLGRDPAEATQVMSLWLWLEQNGEESNLVHKMLSLPDALIDALYDEAAMALACIENDNFPFETEPTVDIPLIQHISKTAVSLRFFHQNRLRVLRGVTKICNDICLRAFQDILQNLETQRLLSRAAMERCGAHGGYLGAAAAKYGPGVFQNNPTVGFVGESLAAAVNNGNTKAVGGDCYDELGKGRVVKSELSDVFSRLELDMRKEGDGQLVPPDERTIFLTFSKGYPISEDEVRDYFARRYGNFIESVKMQEVQQAEEQPLYARLVAKSESAIDGVLERRSKAKFAINGKHVWARKYVRKNPRPSSPPNAA